MYAQLTFVTLRLVFRLEFQNRVQFINYNSLNLMCTKILLYEIIYRVIKNKRIF